MKVIALTNACPGIRYRAHLWRLKNLPVELTCVEVSGHNLILEKVKRQIRLIPKKGPLGYLRWRRDRSGGAPFRKELSELISSKLQHEPYFDSKPAIERRFNGFSEALIQFIEQQRPDFLFQMGVGLIPAHFIRRVPPILNMHPGILPGIRGLDPLFWAHFYGRKDWFGSTLHLIDEGIDTGKPLLRRHFNPASHDSVSDSICKQLAIECDMLSDFVHHYPALTGLDEQGCEKSVYRSTWNARQFQALKDADWWGPLKYSAQQELSSIKLSPSTSVISTAPEK